jgi:hypothetical protein
LGVTPLVYFLVNLADCLVEEGLPELMNVKGVVKVDLLEEVVARGGTDTCSLNTSKAVVLDDVLCIVAVSPEEPLEVIDYLMGPGGKGFFCCHEIVEGIWDFTLAFG